MEYRVMGRCGHSVSVFGIGTMRLPLRIQKDGSTNYGSIDEQKAIDMIRQGIDQGVNYIDTAYTYHQGNSERVLGKALKRGYRERVNIATKLPVWKVKSVDDFDRILNEQLEKLQVSSIDFYLLHALSKKPWQRLKEMGVLDFLNRARQDGRVKHVGFSFHDQLPVFKEIVDSYDWDMCQIQLNLLDEEFQAGVAGMRYAADKGLGVVVMEPLRGGALAQKVPADIQAQWSQYRVNRSPAEWAFRWLANFPEVSVILSGINNLEQLNENVSIFSKTSPHMLTTEESDLINQVQMLYREKIKVGCTGCQYCMPCPSHVDIPEIFRLYNQVFLYDDLASSQTAYQELIKQKSDASQCVACGQCESLCPQNLSIIEKLAEADDVLRT